MRKIEKIIVYGGGIRGKRLCKAVWESGAGVEITAVVDGNPKLWGVQCYGHVISDPARILKDAGIPVCVAAAHRRTILEIREILTGRYQYRQEDVVDYIPFLLELWQECAQTTPIVGPRRAGTANVVFDFYQGVILGGVEAWTKDLCLALCQRGWDNIRICADEERFPDQDLPQEWTGTAQLIDCLGNDPCGPLGREPRRNMLQYFIEKMPCVIVTSYLDTLAAACAAKSLYPDQVRIISVIHSGYDGMYDDYVEMRNFVDAYIGVSQEIRQAMVKRGIEASRGLRMEIPFSCEARLDRWYTEDAAVPLRLGYAGRLAVLAKRVDLLLPLCLDLKARGVRFQMEIVGAGEYGDELRRLAEEYRLEEEVHLLGQLPREEIPDFWKRQDICVNVSDFEGRSISITEAMGNGAVPVVTDVSGVRDDIADGVNGFIVPVGGVEAMADRIEYLAKHRELLRPMGQAAHDEVYPKSLTEPHTRFWEAVLTRMADSLRH